MHLRVYAELLAEQGLFSQADDDGRLHFKYEGQSYAILTYQDDPQYVGIGTTYALPARMRRSTVIAVANDLTRRSKVAKVFVLPSRDVTIRAEILVNESGNLAPLLLRLIRLVQSVASDLFGRLASTADRPSGRSVDISK